MPVINGLTDLSHPTQVIGDMLTIMEHKGPQRPETGIIGDGNNVAHELLYGGAKVGMDVVIASPGGYEPDPAVLKQAQQDAEQSGAKLWVINDPAGPLKMLM